MDGGQSAYISGTEGKTRCPPRPNMVGCSILDPSVAEERTVLNSPSSFLRGKRATDAGTLIYKRERSSRGVHVFSSVRLLLVNSFDFAPSCALDHFSAELFMGDK